MLYFPAAHASAHCPPLEPNCPCGQSLHTRAPSGLRRPAAQRLHDEFELAPAAGEKRPFEHAAQSDGDDEALRVRRHVLAARVNESGFRRTRRLRRNSWKTASVSYAFLGEVLICHYDSIFILSVSMRFDTFHLCSRLSGHMRGCYF